MRRGARSWLRGPATGPKRDVMSPALRLGLPAALGAYLIWGSLPLYIRMLEQVRPAELLAHRILWSVPTALALMAVAANWQDLKAALTPRRAFWLAASSALIAFNWGLYIWAVNDARTMEASLGYYINPLVNVLFGMILFHERLSWTQWLAVAVAAIGVGVMTAAFGAVPWVGLLLCLSFAAYSMIRKQIAIDSRAGFLVEVGLLAPVALVWLGWFAQQPGGRWLGEGGWTIPLLMAAGPITAVPLILYALAAKRLKLSTLGMLQYLGPTLQFLIAVFVFDETFSLVHAAGFACIWIALAIFTADGLAADTAARRALVAKR